MTILYIATAFFDIVIGLTILGLLAIYDHHYYGWWWHRADITVTDIIRWAAIVILWPIALVATVVAAIAATPFAIIILIVEGVCAILDAKFWRKVVVHRQG